MHMNMFMHFKYLSSKYEKNLQVVVFCGDGQLPSNSKDQQFKSNCEDTVPSMSNQYHMTWDTTETQKDLIFTDTHYNSLYLYLT